MIVGCGDLTILLVGLGFHCFLLKCKEKLRHSLGRPSRSDFVQLEVIITLLSHSYGYAVIFPQSETEYAFFTGISELVNYVEPLSFIPVAIFLCAYVVYWIEVTCNKKTGE